MKNKLDFTQWKEWKWHSATRYYNLIFDQDLFGKWTITKIWGGKFTKIHRYRKDYCNIYDIEKLVAQIHRKRVSRGYNLVSY